MAYKRTRPNGMQKHGKQMRQHAIDRADRFNQDEEEEEEDEKTRRG